MQVIHARLKNLYGVVTQLTGGEVEGMTISQPRYSLTC